MIDGVAKSQDGPAALDDGYIGSLRQWPPALGTTRVGAFILLEERLGGEQISVAACSPVRSATHTTETTSAAAGPSGPKRPRSPRSCCRRRRGSRRRIHIRFIGDGGKSILCIGRC